MHGATYEVIHHGPAVTAQEQAAQSHTSGRFMAKVVIVKERDGLAMAVLPATRRLDLDRLKGQIGHGEILLASSEEIREAIPDVVPGAIPPFGRLYGLKTYVDRELLNTRDITMPAGDLETSIRMRTQEYRRLHPVHEGDFTVAPET